MVIVIFEFEMDCVGQDRYFELATALRDEVEKIEGFISVERFENIRKPGLFVSISTWENMEAVSVWKEHVEHFSTQQEAKATGIFKHYRIRVAEVIRDYGSD
ncbi:MAG: antibiotic biosynthesis monooxygenase [Acidiferrobacteraceae bacterium]|nr:antibiotic biosynthesis monooxygenase [Acidiferrobacteraceae bacterium]|tara:strand:+ start:600 stop:905 length:306 start_codon:yes stop_codon:yes gene_type:complete